MVASSLAISTPLGFSTSLRSTNTVSLSTHRHSNRLVVSTLPNPIGLFNRPNGLAFNLNDKVPRHPIESCFGEIKAMSENPPVMPAVMTPGGPLDLSSVLFRNRIIFIGQPINSQVAQRVISQLVTLATIDPEADILIYMNTPGGSPYNILAIYDCMSWGDVSTYRGVVGHPTSKTKEKTRTSVVVVVVAVVGGDDEIRVGLGTIEVEQQFGSYCRVDQSLPPMNLEDVDSEIRRSEGMDYFSERNSIRTVKILESRTAVAILLERLIILIKPRVGTICFGVVASQATLLLAGGEKGMRYSMPNARIMIHQPQSGCGGHVEDVRRQVNEAVHSRHKFDKMYAAFTGQTLEMVEKHTERDYYFSPAEAMDFGLIDGLLETEF
ncbi:hypothetical protein GIB67_005477 [Kingdonia uniflora]|uniref:ATP-dependent Clp protease proteolytic subunit n=1 Tax=Kingdonia uniflora TaxID=39325 RepID=A0A7J7NHE9_9MAGN|nr:hypothetical protein GIB67_005477 [Kingdonia uniflora]